jgi:predicted regulator of Ras-like GTPase activity (Roadblock/LC7/MglB family)
MPGLPPLIEEDVQSLDAALDDLLRHSEAATALIIDKGGPLISQRGALDNFDATTIAALAAGSFCATQAIAERIGETSFSNIYQQGEGHSLLFCNIDDDALLIVIFKAGISAGAIKYYAAATVRQVSQQLQKARQRAPRESMDLVSMNVVDVSSIFTSKPRP